MFTRSGSSPVASAPDKKATKAVKQMKQLSLDSYSRPSTRLSRREAGEAGAKGPREEAQGMLSGAKPSKATGTGFGALTKENNKRKIMES